jgi:hypothetical protein
VAFAGFTKDRPGGVTILAVPNAALAMTRRFLMPAHLRVYPREHAPAVQEPTIHVRIGDLFPLLAQAHRGNYLWLNDFEDDEVVITEDLYEVLRSFRAYRPSA